MGGLFGGGGKTISTVDKVATGLGFNTSAFGLCIPLLLGRNQIAANLLDYQDFTPIAHTETQEVGGKGGLGGGQEMSHTSYTYTVAVIWGLVEGPLDSDAIKAIWIGKEKVVAAGTVPGGGPWWWLPEPLRTMFSTPLTYGTPGGVSQFEFYPGTYPQAPWGYMLTRHPERALGYHGLAIAAASAFDLKENPSLPQILFELVGKLNYPVQVPVTDYAGTIPADTEETETHAIPAAEPFTVTLDLAAGWTRAISVISQEETPRTFTLVEDSPGVGEYVVSLGEYTFNAADTGVIVDFLFGYQAANPQITVPFAPDFYSDGGVKWASSGLPFTPVEADPQPGEYTVATGVYTFSRFDSAGQVKTSFVYLAEIGAEPGEAIQYILTDSRSGLRWPAAKIASLSNYSQYNLANGILFSPLLAAQSEAREVLKRWLILTNSELVWSAGQIKIIPYGDTALTDGLNGAAWTPDLTPLYDLTDDDFLVTGGRKPVTLVRDDSADAFNHWRLQYRDKDKEYAPDLAEAKDDADITDHGLKSADVFQADEITIPDVAATAVNLIKQRKLYNRNTYEFLLDWRYSHLENMDMVTLTHLPRNSSFSLNRQLVRIKDKKEAGNNWLFQAQKVSVGVAAAARYLIPTGQGYSPDYNADPGDVNPPVIFQPPLALTGGRPEIWLAVSGGENWGGCDVWVSEDDATYQRIGQVIGRARHGVLTADLPASSVTPDVTNTLSVDLTLSQGTLLSGTQADADGLNTLCYVDGEYLAPKTATLTAANKYDLPDYLVRGAYGSGMGLHPTGSAFVRLDQAIFKYPLANRKIGQQIFIKLPSFNTVGHHPQGLDEVEPILYTIGIPQTALTVTADITLDGSFETILVDASAHDVTVTLPTGSQYQGKEFDIKRVDEASLNNHSAIITVAGSTIDGAAELSLTQQYQSYRLKNDDGLYHILAVVAGLSTTKTVLNPTPVNNGYSGDVFVGTAGEDLEFGELCYQKADGKFWLARADVVGTMPVLAMAVAAISADTSGVFLQSGFIRKDSWSAWTVGGLAGLIRPSATTAGAVTQDAPAVGHQVQWVGYATAAKILFIDLDLTQYQVGVP